MRACVLRPSMASMAATNSSSVKEIGRSLESALTLLTSGRYAELADQALAMESQLGTT